MATNAQQFRDGSEDPYASYRRERELREQAEAEARAEVQAQNAELRAQHLKKLETERLARQREAAEALEAELAPLREQEMRTWLVAHPDQSEQDFERKAWPHIRAGLTSYEARLAREVEALRRSGRYSM